MLLHTNASDEKLTHAVVNAVNRRFYGKDVPDDIVEVRDRSIKFFFSFFLSFACACFLIDDDSSLLVAPPPPCPRRPERRPMSLVRP